MTGVMGGWVEPPVFAGQQQCSDLLLDEQSEGMQRQAYDYMRYAGKQYNACH
jgi:hypothetical protein